MPFLAAGLAVLLTGPDWSLWYFPLAAFVVMPLGVTVIDNYQVG